MIAILDDYDDNEVLEEYVKEKAWGMETIINLHGCDLDKIKDPTVIRDFVIDLCEKIDMQRYGEPIIERFGSGELYGYSLVQLIHTSCITAHFAEEDGRVFLNIFSCRPFAPKKTATLCGDWFGAERSEGVVTLRK